MTDRIEGTLEVGHTEDTFEVVVNDPDLKPDENGVGHTRSIRFVFSPRQARNLANLLIKHAAWCEALQRGEPSPLYGITGGGD